MGNPWIGQYMVIVFDENGVFMSREVLSRSERLAVMNVLVNHFPKGKPFSNITVQTLKEPTLMHPREVYHAKQANRTKYAYEDDEGEG